MLYPSIFMQTSSQRAPRSVNMSLAVALPVKQLDVLLKAFLHADLLQDVPVQISPDELYASVFATAGVADKEAALRYAATLQRVLARAAHAGWTHAEVAAYLSGSDMPAAGQEQVTSFWREQREAVREAVAARTRWRPQLTGVTWAVETATAVSTQSTAGAGEPVALLDVFTASTGSSSGSGSEARHFRIEADREALVQALGAVAAARKAMTAGATPAAASS